MGCFVIKEDIASYVFALPAFIELGYLVPQVVMTDQDKALTAAIKQKWPNSAHLFCIFHLYRNILKKCFKTSW